MDDQDHTTNATQNDSAMMDQVALVSFVDKLIEERQDPNITDATRPQVRAMLLSEINQAINTHLINRLSEKDQLALDDLLNTNPSDEDLNKFFMSTSANIETEIAAAMLNFRNAYLAPLAKAVSQEQTTENSESPADLQPAPIGEN